MDDQEGFKRPATSAIRIVFKQKPDDLPMTDRATPEPRKQLNSNKFFNYSNEEQEIAYRTLLSITSDTTKYKVTKQTFNKVVASTETVLKKRMHMVAPPLYIPATLGQWVQEKLHLHSHHGTAMFFTFLLMQNDNILSKEWSDMVLSWIERLKLISTKKFNSLDLITLVNQSDNEMTRILLTFFWHDEIEVPREMITTWERKLKCMWYNLTRNREDLDIEKYIFLRHAPTWLKLGGQEICNQPAFYNLNTKMEIILLKDQRTSSSSYLSISSTEGLNEASELLCDETFTGGESLSELEQDEIRPEIEK